MSYTVYTLEEPNRPAPDAADLTPPPELFDAPPLTELEDRDAWTALLRQTAAAIAPRDLMEWLTVRDVLGLAWEGRRLRDAKAAAVAFWHGSAIKTVRRNSEEEYEADLHEEVAGQLRPVELQPQPITVRAVGAYAYTLALEDLERLERLIISVDARREQALRALDLRRRAAARGPDGE